MENVSKRVILAPTNKKTMQMNLEIISKYPGDEKVCHRINKFKKKE